MATLGRVSGLYIFSRRRAKSSVTDAAKHTNWLPFSHYSWKMYVQLKLRYSMNTNDKAMLVYEFYCVLRSVMSLAICVKCKSDTLDLSNVRGWSLNRFSAL